MKKKMSKFFKADCFMMRFFFKYLSLYKVNDNIEYPVAAQAATGYFQKNLYH